MYGTPYGIRARDLCLEITLEVLLGVHLNQPEFA